MCVDIQDLKLFAKQQKVAARRKLRKFSNRDLVSFNSDDGSDVEMGEEGDNGFDSGENGYGEVRINDVVATCHGLDEDGI